MAQPNPLDLLATAARHLYVLPPSKCVRWILKFLDRLALKYFQIAAYVMLVYDHGEMTCLTLR